MRMMFSDFRSRCITPQAWTWASPLATSTAMPSLSRRLKHSPPTELSRRRSPPPTGWRHDDDGKETGEEDEEEEEEEDEEKEDDDEQKAPRPSRCRASDKEQEPRSRAMVKVLGGGCK